MSVTWTDPPITASCEKPLFRCIKNNSGLKAAILISHLLSSMCGLRGAPSQMCGLGNRADIGGKYFLSNECRRRHTWSLSRFFYRRSKRMCAPAVGWPHRLGSRFFFEESSCVHFVLQSYHGRRRKDISAGARDQRIDPDRRRHCYSCNIRTSQSDVGVADLRRSANCRIYRTTRTAP
jgi:hypothetical protein